MNARSERITKARRDRLEKRVIAYWLEKYAGKKPKGKKRSQAVAQWFELDSVRS